MGIGRGFLAFPDVMNANRMLSNSSHPTHTHRDTQKHRQTLDAGTLSLAFQRTQNTCRPNQHRNKYQLPRRADDSAAVPIARTNVTFRAQIHIMYMHTNIPMQPINVTNYTVNCGKTCKTKYSTHKVNTSLTSCSMRRARLLAQRTRARRPIATFVTTVVKLLMMMMMMYNRYVHMNVRVYSICRCDGDDDGDNG